MDIKDIVATFNTVATTIKTLAETPGVNIIPYATTIASAVGALQAAVNAGINILPYVTAIRKTFDGTVPTLDQLDVLDVEITRLESELNAPLPERDPGEPD